MSKKKIIIGSICAVVVVAAGVCAGMLWSDHKRVKSEYELLAEKMGAVLDMAPTIKDYYEKKIDSLDDFDTDEAKKFVEAVRNANETMQAEGICDLSIYDDWSERGPDMSDKCTSLRDALSKMMNAATVTEKFSALAEKLKEGKELALADFEALKESDNAFLKQFAEDFAEYKQKVAEFIEKYGDTKNATDLTKMQEEYGVVQDMGVKLSEKYKEDKEQFKFLTEVGTNGVSEAFYGAKEILDWAQERL